MRVHMKYTDNTGSFANFQKAQKIVQLTRYPSILKKMTRYRIRNSILCDTDTVQFFSNLYIIVQIIQFRRMCRRMLDFRLKYQLSVMVEEGYCFMGKKGL